MFFWQLGTDGTHFWDNDRKLELSFVLLMRGTFMGGLIYTKVKLIIFLVSTVY